MRVIWTPEAADHLEQVAVYLKDRDPRVAEGIVTRIYTLAESLGEMPRRGRVGRQPDTRELVIPGLPYIVIYRVGDDAIQLLAVIHAARDWPPH